MTTMRLYNTLTRSEQDFTPGDPIESLKKSFAYLSALNP